MSRSWKIIVLAAIGFVVYRWLTSRIVYDVISMGVRIVLVALGAILGTAVLAGLTAACMTVSRAIQRRKHRETLIPAPDPDQPATLRVVSVQILPSQPSTRTENLSEREIVR